MRIRRFKLLSATVDCILTSNAHTESSADWRNNATARDEDGATWRIHGVIQNDADETLEILATFDQTYRLRDAHLSLLLDLQCIGVFLADHEVVCGGFLEIHTRNSNNTSTSKFRNPESAVAIA